jgi:hypothetical protein
MRSQKNELFKILVDVGLEPHINQFKWEEQNSRFQHNDITISKLVCEQDNRPLYFTFDYIKTSFYPIYFPGESIDVVNISSSISWDQTKNLFQKWATRLREELVEPDYWGEFARLQSTFNLNTESLDGDTPISASEAIKLRVGISALFKNISKEYVLDKDQLATVENKLNYLSDAINRQSKLDWANTAIGVFVTVAMTIGVSAANSDKFWELVKESLNNAFILLIGN